MTDYDDLDQRVGRMVYLANGTDEQWHDESAPQSAHDAWETWQEALERVQELEDEFTELRAKAARQREDQRRAHLEHARGGPKPKPFKPVDYDTMRLDKAYEIEAAISVADQARYAYRTLAKDPEMLREWRAALLAEFEGAQERARQKFIAAENAYSSWRITIWRLGMVTRQLNKNVYSPTGRDFQRFREETQRGWDALRRAVNTVDPVESGRWAAMSDAELTANPPMWERERMSRDHPSSDAYLELQAIELRERSAGEVISSFIVPASMKPETARKLRPSVHGLIREQ
ncbi:hypothetical protein [Streptomyces sp. URMC 129]|uniref:hypothetical protein n=1 Tax=Streptomyces sp. URMC 129 TaxID=3423407 RepID=UPI003F1953D6